MSNSSLYLAIHFIRSIQVKEKALYFYRNQPGLEHRRCEIEFVESPAFEFTVPGVYEEKGLNEALPLPPTASSPFLFPPHQQC